LTSKNKIPADTVILSSFILLQNSVADLHLLSCYKTNTFTKEKTGLVIATLSFSFFDMITRSGAISFSTQFSINESQSVTALPKPNGGPTGL